MVFPGMAGQSRVEFLQAQTLAAAPSVAHGIALKRYGSACGRRDLRTEALVSSDESGDSDAGSMVAQSSNAVQAVKPALPAPPPGMDPLLFISSSKVLSFMAASCEDLTMDLFVQSPGPPRRRHHPALVTRRKAQVMLNRWRQAVVAEPPQLVSGDYSDQGCFVYGDTFAFMVHERMQGRRGATAGPV